MKTKFLDIIITNTIHGVLKNLCKLRVGQRTPYRRPHGPQLEIVRAGEDQCEDEAGKGQPQGRASPSGGKERVRQL